METGKLSQGKTVKTVPNPYKGFYKCNFFLRCPQVHIDVKLWSRVVLPSLPPVSQPKSQYWLVYLEPHPSDMEFFKDRTFIRCISASWSWDLLRTVGGIVWISVVPSVKGEEELALFSTSIAFVADCWKTLGDKSIEGATVVVAVTNCGGVTCKRTESQWAPPPVGMNALLTDRDKHKKKLKNPTLLLQVSSVLQNSYS